MSDQAVQTPTERHGKRFAALLPFVIWLAVTLGGVGLFVFAASSDHKTAPSNMLTRTKGFLLPGETSHGHYQIELACSACHTPNMGVKQDSCLGCHEQELEIARDTHPATKFSDPTNAQRLEVLDATKCITCHREHVPDRTHPMGLSLPTDYCYHCHVDVADDRPSHKDFAFNSCASAGCHNYHDNRALYENFLLKHAEDPDHLDEMVLPELESTAKSVGDSLSPSDQNAAEYHQLEPGHKLLTDWADTVHAAKGVNCNDCHMTETPEGKSIWQDKVAPQNCARCHESQSNQFMAGRHGMRYAVELPPMTPAQARLPMKKKRKHESLDCSSCHRGHRFDTKHAAVDACLSCHDDQHSRSYRDSVHFELWQKEQAGDSSLTGTGVSCASCHMPRCKNEDGKITVQHNQSDNLRPNEKMIRTVCIHCHGIEFSINALADQASIDSCFSLPSKTNNPSVQMVRDWFEEKKRKRLERQKKK